MILSACVSESLDAAPAALHVPVAAGAQTPLATGAAARI